MDGETKACGCIWLTDGSVDKWLKAACPLLWLGFSNNVLHTLEKKAITLTTPATLEFPLLRKMYFHLKGFTRLRWILLSAFFSFEPRVYYFHSTAGLIKLKFHSHQPASWLPGSGGWERLASWRESLLSHLVSKLYWNWQERSYTELRSINCPVEGKGQRANVALCLIVQAESGHQHQINSP